MLPASLSPLHICLRLFSCALLQDYMAHENFMDGCGEVH